MKKRIINLLLGSVLLVALFSTQAVDFRSLAKLQKNNIANKHNAMLVVAKDRSGKCIISGDANIGVKNAGGFCKGSHYGVGEGRDPTGSGDEQPQDGWSQGPAGDPGDTTGPVSEQAARSVDFVAIREALASGPPLKGAKCASIGGSKAGATGNAGAFCLAADINTLKTPSANFSVANGLPVEGLQFLQVTFRDGSKLVGSRPFPGLDTTIGAKCVSVGGSKAGATGKTGDFCLAADLITSTTAPAHFSVANSLPVASLQIIQVTFRNTIFNQSWQFPMAGAKCASVGGSGSVNEDAGGFCLVSDLRSPTMDLVSFTAANKSPAAGLQFLQVTFKDSYSVDSTGQLIDTPMGAECWSIQGSTASTGVSGEFCLVSNLSTLATGFADFSMANDLPVEGLQFLQVMFADDIPLDEPSNYIKCKSAGGSTSAVGNSNGFCLAADRRTSKTRYANLSVANNLPVTALQFVQIPFRKSGQALGPRQPVDAGAAIGVTMFDVANFPTEGLFLPDLARIAGRKQRYFGISKLASGIVLHSSPIMQTDYHSVFWISR